MNPTKSSARIVRAFTWWLLALGLAGQSAFAVTIAVNEGTSTSTVIYTATDQASGATYSLTGTDASSFTINSSGQVKFQSVPNYETKTSYSFTINTIVSGSTHSTETVVVNVNDLAPVISSGSTTSINEGVAVNSVVYTTTAADPAGGTVTYSIAVGGDATSFSINSSTGVVTINNVPDFETKSSYTITVKASDASGLFSTKAVTVSVNNLPPVIVSATTTSINEGIAANSVVYTTIAVDPAGGTVTYSLLGTDASAFSINSSTGVVTINNVPDFEIQSSYTITVKASDSSGSFTTQTVTINVNDLPPVISSPTTASINEGIAANSVVYTTIAVDPAGGTITYSLLGLDASAFSINSSTGVVTINNVPDFETQSSYNITVKASDSSGSFNTQGVTINVNNLPPVISSPATASVTNGVPASTTVYTAIAADPAGGTVTYSLTGTDASAFAINSSTGVATINAVPNYNVKSSYSINVKASDPIAAFSIQAVTVTVMPRVANAPFVLAGTFGLSNGMFRFSFTNPTAVNFTVLASTNMTLPLSNWTVLGVVTDSPAGQYHFSEPQNTNKTPRFYRVRSP